MPSDFECFILSYFHAMSCQAAYGECGSQFCETTKEFVRHIDECKDSPCQYNCGSYKELMNHCSLITLFYPVKRPCPTTDATEEPPVKCAKTSLPQQQSQAFQELNSHNSTLIQVEEVGERPLNRTESSLLILDPLEVVEIGDRPCTHISIHEGLLPEVVETPELLSECKSSILEGMKDESMPETEEIASLCALELLSVDEVHRHIDSLRKCFNQSKSEVEKNNYNVCRLCGMENLAHQPVPIYCAQCQNPIKHNAQFYSTPVDETAKIGDSTPPGVNTSLSCCALCYNDKHYSSINVDGSSIPKSNLVKMKNDVENHESWVQCEKCKTWQHQICALFNGKKNELQDHYTCAHCYIQQLENGERTPLPPKELLGAKDLPRTKLSDHLEQRLQRKLDDDRSKRAEALGKDFSEVPGVEDLVVRVVSSIDKTVEVKKTILDVIHKISYPKQFPYKSKAIMVFQKIDGIEIVLFGMYVQEYGSNCPEPNRRHAYLAYLDSVKYFRPDTVIKSATGEALRTFVYHEILIGYLDYCKRRGFVSCHIWACPSRRSQDYIFYQHPNIQKMPNAKKLQKWYTTMLQKAAKERIVVGTTNVYDRYFLSSDECKAKFSAARLPYFDGDYWQSALQDIIYLEKEKGEKERIVRVPENSLRYAAHQHSIRNASKETQIIGKFSSNILQWKENLIVAQLQHACTHCREYILSGKVWICQQCSKRKFQLCEKCYEAEQNLGEWKHPSHSREKHSLCQIEVDTVRLDTEDGDESITNASVNHRLGFLNFCQNNYHQFDTIRRAKHSSMMVLYILHHLEEADCKNRSNGPTKNDQILTVQNKQVQDQGLQKELLCLLKHAAQCEDRACSYTHCLKFKKIFHHGVNCKMRASGGCQICKKMWMILRYHASSCTDSECHVPRCKDLREYLRMKESQS
ncbi:Histone acetyltransferase HAC12 [Acorus gramineus]|uniref:histone acetyltransferase n=1 Tax=Acorus gramineus TaxID=55184 RepID=A0AAV9AV60_ACOGR|nr:Histone acetyltransferase HAC12 [Acorus gramineus]